MIIIHEALLSNDTLMRIGIENKISRNNDESLEDYVKRVIASLALPIPKFTTTFIPA